MIEFRDDGDLFACGADMIVNPVNCDGVLGGGLALAFKMRFPAIIEPYVAACKLRKLRPGDVQVIVDNAIYVVNFPTKDELRQPSKIEYVRDGLTALRREAESLEVKCLGIPALGCGLGGLQFDQVKPLIEEAFKDYEGKVVVFSPR
jgi:O-acetyl-ADP-ribose deacetylase (regulator of RNase III)